MTKIYDFTKYLAEKQIVEYETFLDESRIFFGCPDCGCTEFHINIQAAAFCSECELEILLEVDDDEL
jgi:predicted  nucleic acid-binding Zn-ribbon protein